VEAGTCLLFVDEFPNP